MKRDRNRALAPGKCLGERREPEVDDRASDRRADVRSDAEFADGHIEGAVHIMGGMLKDRVHELRGRGPLAIACGSGYRSSIATSLLKRRGFAVVWNTLGGMTAWKEAGLPTIVGTGATGWRAEELRVREQVLDRCGSPSEEARRERGIVRQVLAERAEPAILAARLDPPSYLVKELGERPSDPEKAKAWDKGVRAIESYRNEHGIKDKDNALGHWREGGQD